MNAILVPPKVTLQGWGIALSRSRELSFFSTLAINHIFNVTSDFRVSPNSLDIIASRKREYVTPNLSHKKVFCLQPSSPEY